LASAQPADPPPTMMKSNSATGLIYQESMVVASREQRSNGLIAERAYLELRDRIVRLELPPGTPLRESELMADLAIGRTPLREAVKRLELENLVSVQPRRGTSVTDVHAADIGHISEIRVDLESFAAALAATRLGGPTRASAQALREELAADSETKTQDEWMRLDEHIHHFVWESSGNPYLTTMLEHYFALSLRVWYLVLDRVPGLGGAVHDQTKVLDAILAGDRSAARTAMRAHVMEFQSEITAAFNRG
jgi:DNA-binding GntR family transcriptional regulator